MNPSVLEWMTKAEGDFATAQREFCVRKQPNYDAVCFHAQQCVEKYLKAYLVASGIAFPKTHDLTYLIMLLEPVAPMLQAYLEMARTLTDYAVEFRYPGDTAEKSDAREALKICREFRKFLRNRLGMSE